MEAAGKRRHIDRQADAQEEPGKGLGQVFAVGRENTHARRLFHRQSLRHRDVDAEKRAKIADPVVGLVPQQFAAVKQVVPWGRIAH